MSVHSSITSKSASILKQSKSSIEETSILREAAQDLLSEKAVIKFDPQCIRKKCNWSSVKNEHKLDNPDFDTDFFLKDIKNNSPKLDALLKKIASLDTRDQKKHGKKFKHFIFSDIKSGGQGAKMLASALLATGWNLGYISNMQMTVKNDLKWGPIELRSNPDLLRTQGENFYLLSSVSVFDKPISVKMKKDILATFNSRPDNVYGDLARIIIMDSGFKEGIDLFDIKYVHIFEPSLNGADQKQVIGRGTRTCGQKGLEFHPTRGWPLEVFVYDLDIPEPLRASLLNSSTTQELLMKAMNADIRIATLLYEIERLSVLGSVDYELNKNVHSFSVDLEDVDSDSDEMVLGGAHRKFGEKKGDILLRKVPRFGHNEMQKYIKENFSQYGWEDVKMENLCEEKKTGGASTAITYTPTQDFIGHYFSPSVPVKGMLLYHSVGTGKTCSAIAAATANFEPNNYTILWVTRTTLKNDIWKNMFGQVCNESIRRRIANGEVIPEEQKERMKLLSKAWRIRPISYKQFSNLVSKQNAYYHQLVKENGEADPLRKTLLIIDEAHKLYGGGDLSSLERPDMDALHKSLMTSYAVSGDDSVRLLLMTATPITESPMELVKLVNLCKPVEQQIPPTFELFSETYLEEDGTFSSKGQAHFLDDIAGHISYLNREKDARQFSQPIVKRVLVPIVNESQMKDVKDFDKYIAKTDAEAAVLQLKDQLEKNTEKIEGDLKEMDKSRFKNMQKICENHTEIPVKKCATIVNRNINALVKEVREYTKTIKDQIKTIRKDIQSSAKTKQDTLAIIHKRIGDNPALFAAYKTSTYAALRTACSSKSISSRFSEITKDIPQVAELDRQVQVDKERIDMLGNNLKINKDLFVLKLKQIKEMLKDRDLNDLERSVLEMTLRSSQKAFRKTQKNNTEDTMNQIDDIKSNIKNTETAKKKVFTRIRKTLKRIVRDKKREEKEAKKQERALRKTQREQGELLDEIEDDEIKTLVERRKVIIERDLGDISDDIREKEVEKMRKQKDKEMNEIEKRDIKTRKMQEKVQEKERKQLDKQREKEAAKTRKMHEKTQEKDRKQREKEAAKTRKMQEKTQEKDRKQQEKQQSKMQAKAMKHVKK